MQEKTNYSVLLSTSCICTYKKKLLKIKLTVNCAASFMQLSLNCLMMLDIFSNLWISRCSALCAWAIIRTVKNKVRGFYNCELLQNISIYLFLNRYHKKELTCRFLKEKNFIGLHDVSKLTKASFDLSHVRDKHIHDIAPSLK